MRKLDTEPLAEFGFSPTEIRIFLALQNLGTAKAGDLIKATKIQNSVMHLTLARLLSRGVVSYILRGKTKHYQSMQPSRLLELQAHRTERLQKFVKDIESQTKLPSFPEAEIYEGITGLKNMCFKLIEDAKPGDDYLFFGFSSSNPDYEQLVYSFYREFSDIRMRREIVIKGVAHESIREQFIRNQWPHHNIRFVTFPIIHSASVCRDKVILVPWRDSQVSFLIRSESFAENLREYFNSLWMQGKK